LLVPEFSVAQDRGDRRDRGGDRRDRGDRGDQDYSGYLKRLDRNGDGYLEGDEMSGRTRRWLGEVGINTSRRVKISSVNSMVKRNQRDKEKQLERDKNFSTQIPGFFEYEEEAEDDLPGFGIEKSNVVEVEVSSKQYSRSVLDQIESTLRRYDKDKNGILDRKEVEAIRWGSPKPSDSDLNKDGQLTRDELAERFKRREDSNRSNNQGGSRTTRSGSRFGNSSPRSGGSRSRPSTGSSGSSTRSGFSSRRSGGSSSSSSSSSGGERDYSSYVQGVMERYDKDKDGKLNKSEQAKMSRVPKNADADKDGNLSFDELVDHYSGANSGSKDSTSSKSGDRQTSRGGSRTPSTRDRGNTRSKKFSFSGNDENKDGQIAMSEFTSDWNDEKLAEFNNLDLNGDGYISKTEYEMSQNKSGDSSSSNTRERRFGRNRNRN